MNPVRLGPFLFEEPVARGGMGEVWRGGHAGQGASVGVDYQLPKDWVVGQANSIRLTFRARVKQAQLEVTIKEKHGASLTGQTAVSYDLSANENMEALVELTPPADGYYQLDVRMKVTNELGATQLRINSVPINIGVAKSAKPAVNTADSTGEVILPVTETYE